MRPLPFAIPATVLTLVLSGCGSGGADSAPSPSPAPAPAPAAPTATATIDQISVTLHLDEPANAQIDGVPFSDGPSQDITAEFAPGASGRFAADGAQPPSRTMSSAMTLSDGSGNRSHQTIELSLDR